MLVICHLIAVLTEVSTAILGGAAAENVELTGAALFAASKRRRSDVERLVMTLYILFRLSFNTCFLTHFPFKNFLIRLNFPIELII